MSNKLTNYRLGLFILGGTAVFTVMVVLFGAGAFSTKGPVVETYIDGSVQGLDIGSPLKFRGVSIGEVTEIRLLDHYYAVTDPHTARMVLIRMRLDPQKYDGERVNVTQRIEEWVKNGLRVRLASQGITGLSFIEADFMPPEADVPIDVTWKPEVVYIPSARSQLARVADSIESIARDLERANIPAIAANLERLLGTVEEAVESAQTEKISVQVRATLQHVEELADRINKISEQPAIQEIGPKTLATIENADTTLTEFRASFAGVTTEANETLTQLRGVVTEAREQVQRVGIEDSMARFDDITRSLETIMLRLEGSIVQKDDQIHAILTDMRAVSTNMRHLSDLISQYPSVAAFGAPPTPSEAYKND